MTSLGCMLKQQRHLNKISIQPTENYIDRQDRQSNNRIKSTRNAAFQHRLQDIRYSEPPLPVVHRRQGRNRGTKAEVITTKTVEYVAWTGQEPGSNEESGCYGVNTPIVGCLGVRPRSTQNLCTQCGDLQLL
jgi:hypothetical protein